MAFFNRRKNSFQKRGGGNGNQFRRNSNKPGGIRKPFKNFSQRPSHPTGSGEGRQGGPRRGNRGRGGPRRNRGEKRGRRGEKPDPSNLDKELNNYWGDKNKETREKILNDDLETYWEKKEARQAEVHDEPVATQQKPAEAPRNVSHPVQTTDHLKKKNVAEVPL